MGEDEVHSMLEHSRRTVNIHLMVIKAKNVIPITSPLLCTSQAFVLII